MKVALFCIYFGKFPSYFPAFLKSAEFNSGYDFFIYTDNNVNLSKVPNNVKLIKTTFMSIKRRLQELFDFQICLNSPYKLTDFKPVYGQLFENELSEYTHWGYYDLDIIVGDLSLFATDEELSYFDRIGSRGHLSIFKNDKKNKLAYQNEQTKEFFSYQEVFSGKGAFHFDEMWGINNIYKSSDYKFKDESNAKNVSYFDASPHQYPLISVDKYFSNEKSIFLWEKGTLSIYQQEGIGRPLSYVHLQKRKMAYVNSEKQNNVMIIDQNQVILKNSFDRNTLSMIYEQQDEKWPEGNLYHAFKYYYKTLNSGEQLIKLKLKLRKYVDSL